MDKELERRGHAFCRYADDCNIYVRSKVSGERVMESVVNFLSTSLRLTVNREKSAVGRPWQRKFLGYSMTVTKWPRLKVSVESVRRFKAAIRRKMKRGRGMNLRRFIQELRPYLQGWWNYYRLSEIKSTMGILDEWLRRRLRVLLWRQWKKPRTRVKKLIQRGLEAVRARISVYNGRGPWWNAGASHMNQAFPKQYFDDLGLVSLHDNLVSTLDKTRTAVYGTVRTVVISADTYSGSALHNGMEAVANACVPQFRRQRQKWRELVKEKIHWPKVKAVSLTRRISARISGEHMALATEDVSPEENARISDRLSSRRDPPPEQ